MASILNKDGHRYGELICDSFFSRDETATSVRNVTSNRPLMNVNALAVHQAKIPLTYDTIFSPYNTLTLSEWTFTGALANDYEVDQTTPNTSTYSDGTPNSLTAQGFFGQTVDSTAETSIDAQTFRLRSNYGLVPGCIEVANNSASVGNFSGYKAGHLACFTVGVNSAGSGFNCYVVVQTTSSTAASDFRGTFTFTYSPYLGRKMGLPDGGSWTFTLGDYASSFTNTTGSATPDADAPYVQTEAGTWNSGGNPKWGYYVVPFPFNFEMNMGRYLEVRGSLASDIGSMIYLNDEDAQNSDIISILPISGGYGDIMIYNTPNYEYFKLSRPIAIRSLNLWLTRAEDPANTPVNFKGVDYFLKVALMIKDEDTTVASVGDDGWKQSTAKRIKLA